LQVGGEVFFSQVYLVSRVDTRLSMQVLLGQPGCGRGGFIFLSANRRAQGALLLFFLS
jgi:hypothetical protein